MYPKAWSKAREIVNSDVSQVWSKRIIDTNDIELDLESREDDLRGLATWEQASLSIIPECHRLDQLSYR